MVEEEEMETELYTLSLSSMPFVSLVQILSEMLHH
jgi:hypothetical protein